MAHDDATKPYWHGGPDRAGLLPAIRGCLPILAGALVGLGTIGLVLNIYPAGRTRIFDALGWQAPARSSIEQESAVRRLNDALSEKNGEADQLVSSLASTRQRLEDADRDRTRAAQDVARLQPIVDELPGLKAELAQRQEDLRALQASLDDANRLLKGSESDRARLQLSLAEANRLLTASENERRRLASLAQRAPSR